MNLFFHCFCYNTMTNMQTLSIFVTIVGFVIGLGAVTVIDLHGFLGRKSGYWTEATIRTHRVTKPLIWIGILLVIVGHIHLISSGVSIALWKFFVMGIMILNGCFLSFVVSPELIRREHENRATEILPQNLQTKISISFVVSFLSWWGLLVSFVLL